MTPPSALTSPVKPLNGAANESAQLCCVTVAVIPTSEASQCLLTVQLPAALGQLPLDGLSSVELELQPMTRRHPMTKERITTLRTAWA